MIWNCNEDELDVLANRIHAINLFKQYMNLGYKIEKDSYLLLPFDDCEAPYEFDAIEELDNVLKDAQKENNGGIYENWEISEIIKENKLIVPELKDNNSEEIGFSIIIANKDMKKYIDKVKESNKNFLTLELFMHNIYSTYVSDCTVEEIQCTTNLEEKYLIVVFPIFRNQMYSTELYSILEQVINLLKFIRKETEND